MPGIKTHCVQAALSSAAVYPFVGGMNAAAFGLSTVLIDLDHVIEYVRQTGSPRIWGVFPCCHIVASNLGRGFYVFNIFHTLEFMLLAGLLGLLHPLLFYVLAGVVWHCALDLYVLARHGHTFKRALSIIEYVIRSRNPSNIVRFDDLLKRQDVLMPQNCRNCPGWIRHWRQCRPLC